MRAIGLSDFRQQIKRVITLAHRAFAVPDKYGDLSAFSQPVNLCNPSRCVEAWRAEHPILHIYNQYHALCHACSHHSEKNSVTRGVMDSNLLHFHPGRRHPERTG